MNATASILLGVGVMTYAHAATVDEVVSNRAAWGQLDPLDDHIGYAAVWDHDLLGETVYIRLPDGESVGPLLVYDVPMANDEEMLQRRGWVVCLDEVTWHYLGLPNDTVHPVEVWTGLPRLTNQRIH